MEKTFSKRLLGQHGFVRICIDKLRQIVYKPLCWPFVSPNEFGRCGPPCLYQSANLTLGTS